MNAARRAFMEPWQEYTMNDRVQWSIAALPSVPWAKKIFPELDADAVIEIKGIEHEKSFEIEITDSGIGMSEKQLAILRRKLRMRLNSDTQPKHGIGLRNVQDRIHIQFGTEYGLSVYTKEHCYTKVSIHLPITRGKYSPMDQEGDEKEEEKENEYTAGCRR